MCMRCAPQVCASRVRGNPYDPKRLVLESTSQVRGLRKTNKREQTRIDGFGVSSHMRDVVEM